MAMHLCICAARSHEAGLLIPIVGEADDRMRRVVRLLQITMVGIVVLAGCTSRGSGPSGSMSATARSSTPRSSQASTTVATVNVDGSMSGRRVPVHVGGLVQVVLDSTSWVFTTPASPVIHLLSEPLSTPATGCVAGAGCGTVTARYRVTAAGTTQLSAVRTLCGEVLRCVPERHFIITIVAVR